MNKNFKNIILVSPDVAFASNVANHLCLEYGFTHHKLTADLKKKSGYTVSTCSEVIDFKRVTECGYVIDISKLDRKDSKKAADKVFDKACADYSKQDGKVKYA